MESVKLVNIIFDEVAEVGDLVLTSSHPPLHDIQRSLDHFHLPDYLVNGSCQLCRQLNFVHYFLLCGKLPRALWTLQHLLSFLL